MTSYGNDTIHLQYILVHMKIEAFRSLWLRGEKRPANLSTPFQDKIRDKGARRGISNGNILIQLWYGSAREKRSRDILTVTTIRKWLSSPNYYSLIVRDKALEQYLDEIKNQLSAYIIWSSKFTAESLEKASFLEVNQVYVQVCADQNFDLKGNNETGIQ